MRQLLTKIRFQRHERSISMENSETTSSSSDDRPLFILAVSLSGAGVVLLISTLALCCYFYRTRLRRRNYPLTSLMLENNIGRFSHTRTSTTVNDENGVNSTIYDRPRSPVTTEAEIYFDTPDGVIGKHSKTAQFDAYPVIKVSTANGDEKKSTSFDNPLYSKQSTASAITTPDHVPRSSLIRKSSEPKAVLRKSSSTSSTILPGLPTVMVVDESMEDHRRLVPNDWLSLEIERNQRWLRDSRQAQRNAFETEQKSNASDQLSIMSDGVTPKLDSDLTDAPTEPSMAPSQARKRLRRKLAETIASERVLETTVTFTNDSLDSPASPSSLLPWSGNLLSIDSRDRSLDIKRIEESDDDDLEVIFKERTLL